MTQVLLISRDPQKLADTAKELGGSSKTETLAIDYSNFDAAAREKVKAAIAGKDIGVLLNNVGISYEFPEYFHLLDEDRVAKLLSVPGLLWHLFNAS